MSTAREHRGNTVSLHRAVTTGTLRGDDSGPAYSRCSIYLGVSMGVQMQGGAVLPSRCRALLVALLAMALALLCGCSSPSQQASPPQRPSPRPAAEPADAPVPEGKPDGRVVDIGDRPEGIVADRQTHTVAVAVREPSRLLLIDGRTAAVGARVPLPGTLRHLQLDRPGGPVLVPNETAGELIEVSLPQGKIVRRLKTGVSPHDATAAANGTVFVGNERGGNVVAVKGPKLAKRFDSTQPGGLAAVDDTVAEVDVAEYTLTTYDADRLEKTAEVPAGKGPTHVVADRHGVFDVIDTRGDALLRYAGGPKPHQIGRTPLPGSPYGVSYDNRRDRLWVTLTGRNQVVGIDLGGARPKVAYRFDTVRQPNTVAVDSGTGRVFVAGAANGELQLIDP